MEAAKRGHLDQMIFFSAPLTTRVPPGRPAGRLHGRTPGRTPADDTGAADRTKKKCFFFSGPGFSGLGSDQYEWKPTLPWFCKAPLAVELAQFLRLGGAQSRALSSLWGLNETITKRTV